MSRCNIRRSDGIEASDSRRPENRNQGAKLGPKSRQRLTRKIYRVECVDTLCPLLLSESAIVSEWARYPSIRTKAADGPCQNLARAILRSLSARPRWTTVAISTRCKTATTGREPLAAKRTSHARSRDSRIALRGCTRATHRRRSRTRNRDRGGRSPARAVYARRCRRHYEAQRCSDDGHTPTTTRFRGRISK